MKTDFQNNIRQGKNDAMMRRIKILSTIFFLVLCPFLLTQAYARSCETVVRDMNLQLSSKIDEQELIEILHSLNNTNNARLPARFLNKKTARSRGWKPGKDLWSVGALRGSSIGGDRFRNLEERLPYNKKWREADLDYKGGRRGAKRIVFSQDGQRMVTVDHYKTFREVPPCR